ncbi:MAG: hypothetical protein BGP04_26400 [Rhizobiales bacterium 62-17]|nr:hypothetical protein [Hyphomicrobiales bacterium]OJY01008.1 MAG: hypothetical protein BGP04_26400 [Rhizobiales bacterium 62-17]
MPATARPQQADFAAEAAQLMLRLGLAIILIVVPTGAIYSRRLLFTLVPVGVAMILLGALLAPGRHALLPSRQVMFSPVVQALVLLLAWAAFSLVWTPFQGLALERYGKTAATVALAVAAIFMLPGRTRTSNLNLMPIGVGIAALATIAVAIALPPELRELPDPEGTSIERAALGLVVLVWPALGALAVRERWASAGALAVATAGAATVVWVPAALTAMVVSALVFSIGSSNPRRVSKMLVVICAGLIVLAPALALLAQHFLAGRLPPAVAVWAQPYFLWAELIRMEGWRVLTGHGFDMTVRGLASGYLPAFTPRSLLFEVWYDLGIVGAIATALFVSLGLLAAGRLPVPAASFMLAGIVCILVVAFSGLATMQIWWITLICISTISFTCVINAHPRTARPAARVMPDAPGRLRV